MTLHVTLCRWIGCLQLYWQVPSYLIRCYEQNRRASATARYSTSNSVADTYQKSPLEKQPRVRTPREVGLTFYFYSQDHDSHESLEDRGKLLVDPPSRTTIVVSQNASVVSCWLTLFTRACHLPFVFDCSGEIILPSIF